MYDKCEHVHKSFVEVGIVAFRSNYGFSERSRVFLIQLEFFRFNWGLSVRTGNKSMRKVNKCINVLSRMALWPSVRITVFLNVVGFSRSNSSFSSRTGVFLSEQVLKV